MPRSLRCCRHRCYCLHHRHHYRRRWPCTGAVEHARCRAESTERRRWTSLRRRSEHRDGRLYITYVLSKLARAHGGGEITRSSDAPRSSALGARALAASYFTRSPRIGPERAPATHCMTRLLPSTWVIIYRAPPERARRLSAAGGSARTERHRKTRARKDGKEGHDADRTSDGCSLVRPHRQAANAAASLDSVGGAERASRAHPRCCYRRGLEEQAAL